ncbi:CLUMA_CG009078, isoform A [Clunio marinus]|uniref:CLUMA_CG009078, isoform A n=1 Tax=Clunio marinus TaxID=568069 RepID=A0A1J1I7R8_9DIPT|nr:CLUMA_CG009078, isoform A [Clunio marinus]
MDLYQQSYGNALEINTENEEKWRKYEKDLSETSETLNEFVKSHSLDIMVPMGKKAFVRGKLQHTNEVTVCHGTSLFSDVSTVQAIELLEHRKKLCHERLESLRKERELFRHNVELPEEIFDSSFGQEISELCSEEELIQWRKKHAESVKKHKKIESENRWKESAQNGSFDLEKIFDDFEMIEELAEEMDSLEVRDSNDGNDVLIKIMNGDDSDVKMSDESEEKSLQRPENHVSEINTNSNDLIAQNNHEIVELLKTYRSKIKGVLRNVERDDQRNIGLYLDLNELKDEIEDDIRKMIDDDISESDERDSDDDKTESIELKPEDNKRKVRFSTSLEDVKLIENQSDLYKCSPPENHTIQINFQHSDAKFSYTATDENSATLIAHPGEIVTKFQPNSHLYFPNLSATAKKSILKNKRKETKFSETDDEIPVKKIFHSNNQIVVGEVVEHDTDEPNSDEIVHIMTKADVTKKVSKFKQMRLKC